MDGRRAVVTGASSGIGEATVRRLRADGWSVVAAARRLDRLERLAVETGAEPAVLDVTDDASVAALAGRLDTVHLLVNNAGGARGFEPVTEADLTDWRWMYDVNVLGAARMVQALLPALERSGDGVVVTVTSTAGHAPYPNGAGYTAAKHAERVVLETLRMELLGRPVRIVEVAPGMVATEEFSLNRFGGDQSRADAVYQGVPGPLSADDVADCIAWAASRPSHVNVDLIVVKPRAQATFDRVVREQ